MYAPAGGLNTDHDPGAIQEPFPGADWVYSMNMRAGGGRGTFSQSRVSMDGNEEVPGCHLPAGENVCLGSYEDRNSESVIFFNWNDQREDGIYQFFPAQPTGSVGTVVELWRGDLGFRRHWRITGIDVAEADLLYWVQGNPEAGTLAGNEPRCLNLKRANDYLKKREYRLLIPAAVGKGPSTSDLLTLSLYDETETLDQTIVFPSPRTTREDLMRLFADYINAEMGDKVVAEFCDCEIKLTIQRFGPYCRGGWTLALSYQEVETGGTVLQTFLAPLVPWNFYADDAPAALLTRCRPRPRCEPRVTLGVDPTTNRNNLDRRWFQFAYQYEFVDGETTWISPVSTLVYDPGFCGVDVSTYNKATVRFTDPKLVDEDWLTILRRVRLLVRYGNERPWRLVETFDRCELDAADPSADFRNDGNYQVLEAEVDRLRGGEPKVAEGQAFAGNRGYLCGTREGIDNLECVDASAKLSYADEDCEVQATGTVTVVLRLFNYHTGIRQCVHRDEDDEDRICYGGFANTLPFGGFAENVSGKFRQQVPMAGWPVYSAGSEFAAVTKQVAPPSSYGIVVNADGSFDSSDASKRFDIRSYLVAEDARQEATLTLPVGRHIIRVASHRCGLYAEAHYGVPSEESVYNYGGGNWRRTSTCVYRAEVSGAAIPGTGEFEVEVNVTDGGAATVDFWIYDLSNPTPGNSAKALSGYLVDSNNDADQEVVAAAPAMELQELNEVRQVSKLPPLVSYIIINGYLSKTDHNGFFFFTAEFSGVIGEADYKIKFLGINDASGTQRTVKGHDDNFFPNATLDDVAGTAPLTSSDVISLGPTGTPYRDCVVWNVNEDIIPCASTRILGKVATADGNPVPGVSVAYSGTNRVAVTDSEGEFSIRVYGDVRENGSTPLPGQRNGSAVAHLPGGCCATYLGNFLDVVIGGFGCSLEYSDTVIKDLRGFPITINSIALGVEKRWKRRNTVVLGIEYRDACGRPSAIQAFPAEVYIPFWTEEGYVAGRPVITWSVAHQPPMEATHYLIKRQINPEYSRYVQFVINDAKYVKGRDEVTGTLEETTYGAGDATEVLLDMNTFGLFASENSGSQLAFIPVPGDRVTLMRDQDGALFDGFYDYPIEANVVDSDSDVQRIAVKFNADMPELIPGALVELYTPRLETDVELFFGCGQCFEILDPGTDSRRHGAGRGGAAQDLVAGTPATGILDTGDTYYRARRMPTRDDSGVKTYFTPYVESEQIFDTLTDSKQACIGQPNIEDKNELDFYHRGRVRASEAYQFRGQTRINGYSTFNPFEREDLDQDFGAARAIVRVGQATNLIVVCENQIQPLYTSASQVYDFQGEDTVARSSSPINLGAPVKDRLGTKNPESIVQTESFIYGWDGLRQAFWRYGQDGVNRVSDIGFRRGAIEISEQLRGVPPSFVRVFGGYDRKYGYLIWALTEISLKPDDIANAPAAGFPTAPDPGPGTGGTQRLTGQGSQPDEPVVSVPARAVVYSETRRRWEGDVSLYAESMVSMGNLLLSWKGGVLWRHHEGAPKATFFGQFTMPRIRFVASAAPQALKLFYGARVVATRRPRLDIELLPSEQYPSGMRSRTTKNNVRGVEGDWWAPFFRDYTDPSASNELSALTRGRRLRGHVALILVSFDTTEEVVFSGADVDASASPKTR